MIKKECFGCGQVHNENWPCPVPGRPYTYKELKEITKKYCTICCNQEDIIPAILDYNNEELIKFKNLIIDLIKDNAFAASFQTMGHYRKSLIDWIEKKYDPS